MMKIDKTKIYYYGKTYELTEEIKALRPILRAALDFQRHIDGYVIPDSYWADGKGCFYIRWCLENDSVTMPVWRYRFDDCDELVAEEIPREQSKSELLHEKDNNHDTVRNSK